MKIGFTVHFKKESLHIPDYLELFPKFIHFSPERLSTDEGRELTLTGEPIESLLPGVWNQYFIISGKEITDSAGEKARTIQWAWRNWLDFDELVKKFSIHTP